MSRPAGRLDANDHPCPERGIGSASVLAHPHRVAVVDPAGRVYPSLSEAARAYRLSAKAIRRRARNRVAGWHFAETTEGGPR